MAWMHNEKAPGMNLHSRCFIRGLAHIEERYFRRVVIRRALVVDEDYACVNGSMNAHDTNQLDVSGV